jgi:hypothetical protein
MKEINGDAKNVRMLLSGAKFAIDYYQREYRWEKKQVAELIDDLTEKFLDSHKQDNDRSAVEKYNRYFLGSIIISDKDGRKFIIDGQQRLTTITLLLIHIYRELKDEEQKAQLADLIFSQKFGKRSFNLDVEERAEVMEALFAGKDFSEDGQSESVLNIFLRYHDIEELFPVELENETLPYFADWLIENVYMVEITAYSDADAYTIFETMNDRGLSLTPTDMLKGYVLANITDRDNRNKASNIWRKHIGKLKEIGKDEDADSIKAWLRSQYAQTIRERKRDAQPGDFDLIGTEFHRWVRDHEDKLGIINSLKFYSFIEDDFSFYTHWYFRIRQAAETLTKGIEAIHFNAQNNFTLQYPVLLAPLKVKENEEESLRKMKVVSSYLDILITRRIWNWRSIDYSTMQYAMFLLMRDIRGKSAEELANMLYEDLIKEIETFSSNDRFRLHGTNGRLIHRLLARITDYVETRSGRPSRYREYIQRGGKNGYEIEHIWANHPEWHMDEFAHAADFDEYRNRIGGLLLLPKSFNASYGDLPYNEKRKYYITKQNLLAQSLHEDAYSHDPGFNKFLTESGIPFRAHAEFKKVDLDSRQELYIKLAEQIWSPHRLLEDLKSL